jgi:hypothetical protein
MLVRRLVTLAWLPTRRPTRLARAQIAVEGCGHGELDSIYASIALAEQRNGVKVDLLLICGDFQVCPRPTRHPTPSHRMRLAASAGGA